MGIGIVLFLLVAAENVGIFLFIFLIYTGLSDNKSHKLIVRTLFYYSAITVALGCMIPPLGWSAMPGGVVGFISGWSYRIIHPRS